MCVERVASLAEAWIEIEQEQWCAYLLLVASLAEAWIEIIFTSRNHGDLWCRFPRGRVD